ncbi:MAG: hypothetical protein ACRDV9_08470 [Acidimicrobiia bacterium]
MPVGLPSAANAGGAAGDEIPAIVEQSAAEAGAQDLALVAKANGWTVEQAAASRRAADIVGAVAAQVAAERPEAFVGSRLSAEPGGVPELYIKGRADAFVHNLVAGAQGSIRLIDNQPFSFQELEERKLQVHGALEAQGFKDISTGFGVAGRGKINAGVTRQPGTPTDPIGILSSLPTLLRGSINLAVNDVAIAIDEESFGGMRTTTGAGGLCTSGWSVYDSTGQTGVTTAGHCDGINAIDHPGHGVHGLTHQREHRGQWGDVEWKTSGEIEPARFYATATEVRTVIGVEPQFAISEGEQVCLYGRSSNNRDCSRRVQNVSQTCTNDGVRNDRLVLMDGDIGIPGDSGGGWSWANRAYGSHKGNCADVPGREVFSVADLYDEALGVRVRTDTLPADGRLDTGAGLISDDGRFTAWMQGDGNFVVYHNGVGAIWASSWCGMTQFGGGRTGLITSSGVFTVNQPIGPQPWMTTFAQTEPGCPSDRQTLGSASIRMVMQTDGNLVMYHSAQPVWATNTCCR